MEKATMATSIQAWNEYFRSGFMHDLCETFPECLELVTLQSVVDAMLSEDEYSVLEKFVEEIEPHTEALTTMDEAFFLNSDIDFLNKLGVRKYWTPDLEEETKQAIWTYLQTLLVMAKTIQSIPPSMLKMLEDYAGKVSAQMGDNVDPNQLDLQQLGLGAMQHIHQQQAGGTASPSASAPGPSQAAGMFGSLFENVDISVGAPQAGAQQRNPAAARTAPTVPQQAAGGLDRLLAQLNLGGATSGANSGPQNSGNIWGTPQPPLYGNHPIFQPPPPGSRQGHQQQKK